VYVWATAIRNIGGAGTIALASVFFVLAALVAVPRTRVQAVMPLLVVTAVVWAAALVRIWIGDWSIGFKVVHSGLAVVSVALGWAAVRSVKADVERERQAPAATAGLEELADG
jgi:hypothetical protein